MLRGEVSRNKDEKPLHLIALVAQIPHLTCSVSNLNGTKSSLRASYLI